MPTVTLTPEARSRLDAHLDAVEAALTKAGTSRDQRRAVVDDLEAQILDMLASRTTSPTAADVDSVLATLDPPNAYGSASPTPSTSAAPIAPPVLPRPRYSRTAIWGLVCILTSLFLATLVFVAGLFLTSNVRTYNASGGTRRSLQPNIVILSPQTQESPHTPPVIIPPITSSMPASEESLTQHSYTKLAPFLCMFIIIGPLGLLGTILGWIAFAQIRRSNGMLTGRGLALFDGLFWPVLVIVAVALYCLSRDSVTPAGAPATIHKSAPYPPASAPPNASA